MAGPFRWWHCRTCWTAHRDRLLGWGLRRGSRHRHLRGDGPWRDDRRLHGDDTDPVGALARPDDPSRRGGPGGGPGGGIRQAGQRGGQAGRSRRSPAGAFSRGGRHRGRQAAATAGRGCGDTRHRGSDRHGSRPRSSGLSAAPIGAPGKVRTRRRAPGRAGRGQGLRLLVPAARQRQRHHRVPPHPRRSGPSGPRGRYRAAVGAPAGRRGARPAQLRPSARRRVGPGRAPCRGRRRDSGQDEQDHAVPHDGLGGAARWCRGCDNPWWS